MSIEINLNEQFANRYTNNDLYFNEYLNKKEIPIPCLLVEKRGQNHKSESNVILVGKDLEIMFANRYTADDSYFTEYLNKKEIPPPCIPFKPKEQNFKSESTAISAGNDLNKLFANRYTADDPYFTEYLKKKEIQPPCIPFKPKSQNSKSESTVTLVGRDLDIMFANRYTADDPYFTEYLNKKEIRPPCIPFKSKDQNSKSESAVISIDKDLNKLFSNRFTVNDPYFTEYLKKKEIPPPCILVEKKDQNYKTDSTVVSIDKDLNKLFSNRYTVDDPYFTEYLKRKEIPPPYILVEMRFR